MSSDNICVIPVKSRAHRVHGCRHPAAAVASNMLSAFIPPSITDVVELPRSVLTIELPGKGVPAVCAIRKAQEQQQETDEQAGQPPASDAESQHSLNGEVHLILATADGLLYDYRVQGLKGATQQLSHSLEGEWYLLQQSHHQLPQHHQK